MESRGRTWEDVGEEAGHKLQAPEQREEPEMQD
jgi:hypothetical protein